MALQYKLVKNPAGDVDTILRKNDNAWIPKSLTNTDYQEYLKWVDEGNTAEAAD